MCKALQVSTLNEWSYALSFSIDLAVSKQLKVPADDENAGTVSSFIQLKDSLNSGLGPYPVKKFQIQ